MIYRKILVFFIVFLAVTWPDSLFSKAGNNFSEFSLINQEQDTDVVTIVAFGNSITATRKTVNKVFAQRLPVLLKERGIKANVINSGIGGSHTGRRTDHDLFKIRHALDRFEPDVLAHNPDIVIIGFGTNDAHIDSKERNGKSRIPLDKYKANLEYMINRLLKQNSKVILMAPNILGANYGEIQNDRLIKYVKVVRRLARKYNLGLADNYRLFVNFEKSTGESFDTLMLDGVHPNDRGHELIADQLVNEIILTKKNEYVSKKN